MKTAEKISHKQVKKLQKLERKHKRLIYEISSMDRLFRLIGFPSGIESLKASAEEMYNE